MSKRTRAAELNQQALELQDRGHREEAIELYQKASAADPKWPAPLYNLGLLFKKKRNWKESLKYNRLATSLDPKHQPAWWNFGIAATALERWQLARSAWRGFGLEVPDGQGPLDFPCGFGPIRINPDGDAEIVWSYRLDPARAELASIPFPESKHHWRDIVLNDGAPKGYRQYKGKEIPVFDELDLFKPSPFGTYVARVHMPNNREYIVNLARIASELEGSAEDWSTSVRILCRACSEGRPHEEHDTEATPPDGVHTIGIAARDRKHATRILRTWESTLHDVQVESLADALT
ncbi:MAG TPA: tetratricopeptide repeat protein [Gemmataceae bacterium]|nr:tetratricopeptide repeat protein [Gemmataceae bacterium]